MRGHFKKLFVKTPVFSYSEKIFSKMGGRKCFLRIISEGVFKKFHQRGLKNSRFFSMGEGANITNSKIFHLGGLVFNDFCAYL